jgi:hypothetical protein
MKAPLGESENDAFHLALVASETPSPRVRPCGMCCNARHHGGSENPEAFFFLYSTRGFLGGNSVMFS